MGNCSGRGKKREWQQKKAECWERCGIDESSTKWEWVHEALETAEWIRLLCCQLFPLTKPVRQPSYKQCHYTPIWPQGFCESWSSNKSTQCLEMWNNRQPFTGAGVMAFLWEVHLTSCESHTNPFYKCFPLWASDSQLATVLASHPAWCVISISFSRYLGNLVCLSQHWVFVI